nr:hypothetical protein [Tanacetum cinerariifolium]
KRALFRSGSGVNIGNGIRSGGNIYDVSDTGDSGGVDILAATRYPNGGGVAAISPSSKGSIGARVLSPQKQRRNYTELEQEQLELGYNSGDEDSVEYGTVPAVTSFSTALLPHTQIVIVNVL